MLIGALEYLGGLRVKGYVRVLGVDVLREGIKGVIGRVGVVLQNPVNQVFSLTVEEEVAFPLENLLFEEDVIRSRLEEALELMGISGLREANVQDLSMGQLQRVVLASTIALKPRILLLDEPCSYIDPATKERFYEFLGSYWRKSKATVIVVEHDLEYVLRYASKLLLLNRRIVAYGDPIEVFSRVDTESYGVREPLYIKICRGLLRRTKARSIDEAAECIKSVICSEEESDEEQTYS
ncbi:MAG: hypothetical protein DRO13_04085 [Thermoprotei archaeon]|nr:MAG: hypothetical protein DRO13_04085 [Thermoprotei archaeon]